MCTSQVSGLGSIPSPLSSAHRGFCLREDRSHRPLASRLSRDCGVEACPIGRRYPGYGKGPPGKLVRTTSYSLTAGSALCSIDAGVRDRCVGLHCGRHIYPLVKYNNASVAQVPVDSVPNYLPTEFANTCSRPRHFAPAAFFARSTTTSRVRSAGRSSQVTTTSSNTLATGSSWLFVRMYPRHNVIGTDSVLQS